MKRLISILLTLALVIGLFSFAITVLAEEDISDYQIQCTEKEAYERGEDFFKTWYIANKGHYVDLVHSYWPLSTSVVMDNKKSDPLRLRYYEWRLLTLDFPAVADQLSENFNGTSDKQKAVYEAFLFNLLLDEKDQTLATTMSSEYSDTLSSIVKLGKTAGFSEWKKLQQYLVRSGHEAFQLSDNIVDRYDILMEELTNGIIYSHLSKITDITKGLDYVNTVGEYFDGLTHLSAIEKNYEASEILDRVKYKMYSEAGKRQGLIEREDHALAAALDDFSAYLSENTSWEDNVDVYLGQKTIREVREFTINGIWSRAKSKLQKLFPELIAVDVAKFGADQIFNTSNTETAYCEMENYCNFEVLLKLCVCDIIDNCNDIHQYDNNAYLFDTAYSMLKNASLLGLDSYRTYLNAIYRDGVINHLFPQINEEKYNEKLAQTYEVEENLKKMFWADEINARNAYIDAVEKYDADLYEEYCTESGKEFDKENPVPYDDNQAAEELKADAQTYYLPIENDKVLKAPLEIVGNVVLNGGEFKTNGYDLTVYGDVYIRGGTFNCRGDIDIKGNIYQTGGEVIIPNSSGSVTVEGNYEQGGGLLSVDGGGLSIGGNHTIGYYKSEHGGIYYYGDIDDAYYDEYSCEYRWYPDSWQRPSYTIQNHGTVEVTGDVLGYYVYSGYFRSGKLNVGGNVVDYSDFENYYRGFRGYKDFTLTAKGSNDLRLQNLDGMNIVIENAPARDITLSGVIATDKLTAGKMTVKPENLKFGAKLTDDVTFDGDVTLRSSNLNGHNLKVKGDVLQLGILRLNGGTLDISGNYTIGNEGNEGTLYMTNSSDVVNVGGNMNVYSSSSSLTNGVLRIKGDFSQKRVKGSNGFYCSENHKTILNGDKLQKVVFESYPGSQFNILELTQKEENYDFNPDICWNTLITHYIELDKTSLELPTKQSAQLNLTGVPSGSTVTWKSSNSSVAAVDQNGKVTAKTYGKAVITATVTSGSDSIQRKCNVQTRFYDVADPTMSGYTQIYWAADKGVTKGYNEGEYFGPTKKCTRQEFAIFLWRSLGQPKPKSTSLPFTDTKDLTGSALNAIAWASENGIIKGFADNTFKPKNNVTREQIVIMIWRAAGQPKATKEPTFTDIGSLDNTASAYKGIAWASENGIVQGFYTDNTFRPKENSKRNQVVIMLYRYVNKFVKA